MAFQPLLGTVVVELTVRGQHGLRCDSGPAPVSSLNEPLAADLMKRGWAQHSWLLWPPKPALSPRLPLHPINPFQPLCCTPSGRRGFDPLLGWASTSPEGRSAAILVLHPPLSWSLIPGHGQTHAVAQHGSARAALGGPPGFRHLQHRADEGPGQGKPGLLATETSRQTRVLRSFGVQGRRRRERSIRM